MEDQGHYADPEGRNQGPHIRMYEPAKKPPTEPLLIKIDLGKMLGLLGFKPTSFHRSLLL
jgi:hypothetical protein